jgi:D-alanyl-D-alanine carboxypeptidase
VTSARDIALLARALLIEFPQHAHYYKIPAIKHGRRVLRSYNLLLGRVAGVNGMKTGYICNSAFNLVVSARRGNTSVIAVVLGARSGLERAVVARNQIERGFSKSRMFSVGGASLTTLAGKETRGSLPPDGYCRKNKRPTADQLAATYGRATSGSVPGVRLSFAGLSGTTADGGGSAFPTTVTKRKKSKKKRRRDYLTELLGPRTAQAKPVRVFLGTPGNPSRKVIKIYPLPRPRPKNL